MVRMMGATDYRGQTWDSAALTNSQVRARERRQWLAEWAADLPTVAILARDSERSPDGSIRSEA